MSTEYNWTPWTTSSSNFESKDSFEPKVVEDLPDSLKRGRVPLYITEKAVDLALNNPNKWVICHSENTTPGSVNRRRGASLRSSCLNFNKRNVHRNLFAKVVTNNDKLEVYLRFERMETDNNE